MSALMIAELEARASAIDSVLTLARVRMERDEAILRVGFYLYQARHHLMKLAATLEASADNLGRYELDELADQLDAAMRRFGPGVRVTSARPTLFGQLVRSHAVRLFNDVHELVAQLRERSAALTMNVSASRVSPLRPATLAPASFERG